MSEKNPITITGVKNIQEVFDRIAQSITREGVDAVTITAKQMVIDAKNIAPVGTPESTGVPSYIISYAYRRSIRDTGLEINMDKRRIRKGVVAGGKIINPNTGRPVDYALQLEYGRSRQAPEGVLSPTAMKNSKFFLNESIKAIIRGIKTV